MKNLRYFIGGALSILFVLPLLNKLLELAELWIETLKLKPTKKILEGNKDTIILREFLSQPEQVGDYEIEYLYDEDDE